MKPHVSTEPLGVYPDRGIPTMPQKLELIPVSLAETISEPINPVLRKRRMLVATWCSQLT